MRARLVLALLLLSAFPAHAGETAWQEIAPGVQLRLISSGKIKPDGTTLIGLEIDMPANTKTYWRVPGDTGFPAELDFSGSMAIAGHKVHWPFPQRDETPDYLDYVYYGPTVLPIELQLDGSEPELELSTVLGICSEVCIPAQASFSMPLADTKPDMANGLRLKQAMAQAPITWPDEEAGFGPLVYDARSEQLLVPIANVAIDASSLIVTSATGTPLFGTPQKSREPNLVVVPVLGESNEIDWASQSVQLTFMTYMGAFEATQPVQQSVSDQ